jgi:hypothetical protein
LPDTVLIEGVNETDERESVTMLYGLGPKLTDIVLTLHPILFKGLLISSENPAA